MAEEDKTTSIETAILRAKREWETIFDAVSDMLFLVDSTGIILRSNKTAAKKIGMTYVDLLGTNINEYLEEPIQEFKVKKIPAGERKLKGLNACFWLTCTEVQTEDGETRILFAIDRKSVV